MLDILIAVGMAVVIWSVAMLLLRMLASKPPEIDPSDVVVTDQDYRCTVCGAEVTMKMVNVAEDKPPKHCREEMVPVWRP